MRRGVLIAGGGTGGHIFPMVAIAEALRARGVAASEITFAGSRRGLESRLLAGRAEHLVLWPGRGLSRRGGPRALVRNLGAVLGLGVAIVLATVHFARHRPRVVVSLGGYAALASSVAAVLTRTPLVLVQLDAISSASHRVVTRFAAARTVPFDEGSHDDVSHWTGVPLRQEILDAARPIDVPGGPLRITVMTGSLGSERVNDAVADLAQQWSDRTDVAITHITGTRDYPAISARRAAVPPRQLVYEVVEFAAMAPQWSQTDLAICRAGANSVAELACVGIASILVPLPRSPGDHQTANARALEAVGAAIVVRDEEVSATVLARLIDELIADPARRRAMADAARSQRSDGGAPAIAELVLSVAR